MALKKCKECGQEISKKAKECPGCGHPQKPKQYSCGSILWPIIGLLIIISLINSNNDKIPKTSHQPQAVPQQDITHKIKTFTEKDFYWDKETTPHKDIIIAGVNKIHRENKRCRQIDPSSAYTSGSKGTKDNPVFYVTCGEKRGTFNAFFSKSDVEADRKLSAIKHMDKSMAISLCESYAKQHATHPSSVKFSKIMDIAVTEHPNGRTRVSSTFTAKNSFNLETKFKISCLLDGNKMIEANIVEN